MLLSPAGSNASLPSSLWGRFKGGPKSNKDVDLHQQTQNMALARQRLLTLAFGDMETIRMLPQSFPELEAVAREWAKPPPDAVFSLRVPVEFASIHAARMVAGPYIYLTGEDSFQIAIMGVHGLRVEIVSDAPPPPDEPPPPPPPPVLEMPATFALEIVPGQQVALETTVASDGDLDMARMEDGTMVEGSFWGRLTIVHDGDNHKMDFSGTRILPAITNGEEPSPAPAITDIVVDSRALTKLAEAATKPVVARCNLSILPPAQQYCDVVLTFANLWKLGMAWPPAEVVGENKVKYFVRVHPGGAMEHFESMMVVTSIFYEAIPDPDMLDPQEMVDPRTSFAMPTRDFLVHIQTVLEKLGLSIHARTNFISNNLPLFSQHKNIAYRFLRPTRIAAAVDITVEAEACVFTRLFLMFRGLSDDDLGLFASAGEKEANNMDWPHHIGYTDACKDASRFRLLEMSVLDLTP